MRLQSNKLLEGEMVKEIADSLRFGRRPCSVCLTARSGIKKYPLFEPYLCITIVFVNRLTIQGTSISPLKVAGKMIPRWDMLVPRRVSQASRFKNWKHLSTWTDFRYSSWCNIEILLFSDETRHSRNLLRPLKPHCRRHWKPLLSEMIM